MHLSAEDFESKAVASTTAHPASHILTNTFTNLYKYILQFGKKTFCNLNKYVLCVSAPRTLNTKLLPALSSTLLQSPVYLHDNLKAG